MKKIFTVSFFALASGFGAYLLVQKNKIERVVDKLKFSIKDVQNFNISGGNLKADLFLRASNPTSETISLNTGILKAEELRVYEKDTTKRLAVSDLQISEIELPANGYYDFPALSIQIPLLTGAAIALNQLTSNKSSFIDKLTIELDIKAANFKKTITI